MNDCESILLIKRPFGFPTRFWRESPKKSCDSRIKLFVKYKSHAITAACITFLEELGKWAVLRGPEPESLVRGMKLEGAALSAQKG